MARRLLTAGLLLAALAWCGRTTAKPPDLPLVDNDALSPQDPLVQVEAAKPSQPNPFPQAAELAMPVVESSFLFQIRPAARRMIVSCLLFGVHPLMTLTPPDNVVAVDDDDEANQRAIELLKQSEDLRQLADKWERFWNVHPSYEEETGEARTPAQPEQLHVMPLESPQPEQLRVMPQESPCESGCPINSVGGPSSFIHSVPQWSPAGDPNESVCPYIRQLQCAPRHEAPVADFDSAPDVLHNLQMLHQAQTLMEKALELGRSGRVAEALACLELAQHLCPGSRIDEAVQEAALDILVPIYCGSPSNPFGAQEESEPPAEKTKDHDGCPACSGCGEPSILWIEKDGELEQKLALPVSVKFQDAPLREVIDDLREWQDINICVDKAALDAEEISLDQPVTLQLDDISLHSTLQLILKQAHLAYVVKGAVLQVTTERAARGKLQRVCYAVADLLEGDLHCPGTPVANEKETPVEGLIKLITSSICPKEWSGNGGPATIDFHPVSRSLVVNATADMQEQIVDLLSSLQSLHHKDGEEEEHQDVNPHEGCKMLLKKCHEAMDAGRQREAADLAAKAYALDPQQAAADPLVYKMHLAGDEEDPVDITPCLPPVDPDTPAALEQLYRESLRPPSGGAEEQEPPAVEPPHVLFECGFGLDGSVQMFGQLHRGAAIWHAFFGNGGVAVWASPDGGADPTLAPAVETVPDGDWDY